ncbi:MAG TPA: hypothetical protein VKB88_32925 [Bryobacteraceae bacterium]|nr:hypothetical protein [Bryobacteraceae bacterium]
MDPVLKPIFGLRLLTVAVTILLIAMLFLLPKSSPALGFLVGAAIGLSVGVQTIVWSRQLRWRDNESRGGTIQMNLTQQQR